MKVEMFPLIRDVPGLADYVRRASEVLEEEIQTSQFRDEITASWTLPYDGKPPRPFLLCLSDSVSHVDTSFWPEEIDDTESLRERMRRLWGNLLQARSHKLIESRTESTESDRYLDGSEALDQILDSLAEYSEREKHEPSSIKLPVRYATALMKLGPTYWGDFYRQIRESGLKAFDGQTLLGMKVELVLGGDAELQVA